MYVEDVENATGPGFSAQEVCNSVKKAQQAEYKSKLESKNVYRVPRDRFIQLAPQLSVDDQRMPQQNTHLPPGDKLTVLVPQCEQLGMTFSSNKPGTHFLSHVVPGSVAERSGLMQGMAIVAINGHTVEGMPSKSLFELIENSHREAMCTIEVQHCIGPVSYDRVCWASVDPEQLPQDGDTSRWRRLQTACSAAARGCRKTDPRHHAV